MLKYQPVVDTSAICWQSAVLDWKLIFKQNANRLTLTLAQFKNRDFAPKQRKLGHRT